MASIKFHGSAKEKAKELGAKFPEDQSPIDRMIKQVDSSIEMYKEMKRKNPEMDVDEAISAAEEAKAGLIELKEI